MVASKEPEWLQGTFDTLNGMFDRVGMQTDVGKMDKMVCRPFQAEVSHLEVV